MFVMFGETTPSPSHSDTIVAASTNSNFNATTMFVTFGETKPPPAQQPFLFFNTGDGDMRSIGQHSDIIATDAATLEPMNGAPKLTEGAIRVLIDIGL